jgi:RNA polymerase sigma-70 factor (ECF subfamily)
MAMQRANLLQHSDGGSAAEALDAGAFERLYEEHSPAVYRTALRVLANPTQAQDVVQDVFLRVWRQPGRFDAQRGSLQNYLRLMARSRALDVWREAQAGGRARDRMKVLALRGGTAVGDDPALAAELRRDRMIVAHALERLPAAQRSAVLLAYWGGLTAEQIAERSGVPVGTVKSRIRLGLTKLRERCEPELGVPLAA